MIGFDHRLARASHPPNVRAFAEQADALLEAADPDTVLGARGYLHMRDFGYLRIEPRAASVQMPRTRRSRITAVTARLALGDDRTLTGTCDCVSDAAVCEHIAAALTAMVDHFKKDDKRLMHFQGMSEAEIEAVIESRRPGRTRWAASAYESGPELSAALAREPGPLPDEPQAPGEPGSPQYASTVYLYGGTFDAQQLERQAAVAAATAQDALADAAPEAEPTGSQPASPVSRGDARAPEWGPSRPAVPSGRALDGPGHDGRARTPRKEPSGEP